jgi:hypothetical protein
MSDTRSPFAHVVWIGGASDAGKTTAARLVAERHPWQRYPCDFHERNHLFARRSRTPSRDLHGARALTLRTG